MGLAFGLDFIKGLGFPSMLPVLWVGVGSGLVVATEPGIVVVFFALVAGEAKGLEVAEVVGAAEGEGDDVINAEGYFWGGFAAGLALVAIALINILSDGFGDGDAGSFGHGLRVWLRVLRMSSRGEVSVSMISPSIVSFEEFGEGFSGVFSVRMAKILSRALWTT